MTQFEKIKKLINTCEFYNKEPYKKALTFEELPVIDKRVVIENYNLFISNNPPLYYTQTSGSNGSPLRIVWNYNDYLRSIASIWRLRAKFGIKPTDFQLTCHASVNVHGERIDKPIVLFSNILSLSKICYSDNIMHEYISAIEKVIPKWIYAQPSFVYVIGKYLKMHAPQLIQHITYIELTGELLTQDIKTEIEDMFPRASVVNMYGMQEFNSILYEEDGLMKVIEDNAYVEILKDGKKCQDNEEGDIVITGLHNSAFPLIRYNSGDRGKRLMYNGMERYVITSGRANDSFMIDDHIYDGSIFFDIINEYNKRSEKKILRFQVVFDGDFFLFMVWNTSALPDEDQMALELHNIVIDILHLPLPIKVKQLSGFDDFVKGGNKIKYFINNVL